MSVSTIITCGFGSFGSIPLVITDGYSISSIAPIITTIRGHRIKRRRHRIRYYDDIEKLKQEQIEEVAAKIANEEICLEKEKENIKNEIKVEKIFKKISLLKSEISDIMSLIGELEDQKREILKRLEFLRDEEDIEVLLLI